MTASLMQRLKPVLQLSLSIPLYHKKVRLSTQIGYTRVRIMRHPSTFASLTMRRKRRPQSLSDVGYEALAAPTQIGRCESISLFVLVRMMGLEPTRILLHWLLRPERLPFRHIRIFTTLVLYHNYP